MQDVDTPTAPDSLPTADGVAGSAVPVGVAGDDVAPVRALSVSAADPTEAAELTDGPDDSRLVVERQDIWQGPIMGVIDEQVALGEGRPTVRRQTATHHDAVAILAWREGSASSQPDGEPEILMIRQYRHPVRAQLWEIPAGLLDQSGEDPLCAAQRELAEETDYQAAQWDVLTDTFASPGFTTEGSRCFLARGLTPLPHELRTPREEEEAEIVPTWVRFETALAAVLAGCLHNPSTVVGILAAAHARQDDFASLRSPEVSWMRSPLSM